VSVWLACACAGAAVAWAVARCVLLEEAHHNNARRWVATDKSSGEMLVVRKVDSIVDTAQQQLKTVGALVL
jgi:hypothetical protein